MSHLNEPHFQDAEKAREYLERLRWPDGPVCPKCGLVENQYRLAGTGGAKGTKGRPGLLKCGGCRKQYSVTVGTVFERSKIALNVWLQATFLLCSSKKGMSSHQLHRMLGVTYKTASFMSHRIREAMKVTGPQPPMGENAPVEVDETYWGGSRRPRKGQRRRRQNMHTKMKILTLVDRSGRARSFHLPHVTGRTLRPILRAHISPRARLMTDEATYYKLAGKEFAEHGVVNHSAEEYARGDVHTQNIEGFFSILKRGLTGVYQHVSEQHLHRYLSEFDQRYTHRGITDSERTESALRGIEGKRLTYAQPSAAVQ